jgi:hypothetical protein
VIPQADIVAWRRVVPWADDGMVEQDLVLSRALVESMLAPDVDYDPLAAIEQVAHQFVDRLPGSPWKRPPERDGRRGQQRRR